MQPPDAALNTNNLHQCVCGGNAFCAVFRAQRTCLLAANFPSARGATSVLPKPLAGFRGHFRRWKERGKGNERTGKER